MENVLPSQPLISIALMIACMIATFLACLALHNWWTKEKKKDEEGFDYDEFNRNNFGI